MTQSIKLAVDEKLLGPIKGFGYDGGFLSFSGSGENAYQNRLIQIISNLYTFLTLVGGIMFILYFVLGALNWISAGGKQDQVEKAKKMMTDAAIGMIIVVLSYPVVFIVGKILGLNILHPETIIPSLGPNQ